MESSSSGDIRIMTSLEAREKEAAEKREREKKARMAAFLGESLGETTPEVSRPPSIQEISAKD